MVCTDGATIGMCPCVILAAIGVECVFVFLFDCLLFVVCICAKESTYPLFLLC